MCFSFHFPYILQVSANGNVLRSEIVGAIKMRVYLSGMPELRLGLNDKVLFESTGSKYKGTHIILLDLTNLCKQKEKNNCF